MNVERLFPKDLSAQVIQIKNIKKKRDITSTRGGIHGMQFKKMECN